MKKIIVSCAVVALFALGMGQASARTTHQATKVTVVMHDPGCHWFSVGGKLRAKLAVNGPVRLLNLDEDALVIKGAGAVRHEAVGKTVALGKGTYVITMVGQHADDNHLKLVVR